MKLAFGSGVSPWLCLRGTDKLEWSSWCPSTDLQKEFVQLSKLRSLEHRMEINNNIFILIATFFGLQRHQPLGLENSYQPLPSPCEVCHLPKLFYRLIDYTFKLLMKYKHFLEFYEFLNTHCYFWTKGKNEGHFGFL